MNESQFAYNGFTLDELRSLAASPQVGTMQAMPASFRALADRVGEVADLLSHAQADLPNWWRGQAAEQAAATLGRAAAEAREFHGSALAAATAVSRCAQVVAEQQHQMMNVPDVREPGVTAVVQRPATPFEALEAARQDAQYQAAHEQAVQVVNGIAAQYVETHSQLSEMGIFRAENFTLSNTTQHQPQSDPDLFGDSTPRPEIDAPLSSSLGEKRGKPLKHTDFQQAPSTNGRTSATDRNVSFVKSKARGNKTALETSGFTDETPPRAVSLKSAAIDPTTAKSSGSYEDTAVAINPTDIASSLLDVAPPVGGTETRESIRPLFSTEVSTPLPQKFATETTPTISYLAATKNDLPILKESKASGRLDSSERQQLVNDNAVRSVDWDEPNLPAASSQPAYQSRTHESNTEGSPLIPSYPGVGSVHRLREEHSPRPAYLKERKSVWLSDTFAAPADGVISPDWFEHH